jgi:hypothetical protein
MEGIITGQANGEEERKGKSVKAAAQSTRARIKSVLQGLKAPMFGLLEAGGFQSSG